MNLNEEEFKEFLKDCEDAHKQDTKFLLERGWVQDGDIWISPKGRRCRNHLGFFNDEFDLEQGLAIDVAKHEIVLEQFEQFKVELYDEDDEEPNDWFFPCIKDGKLYSYIEAVEIAVYDVHHRVSWERYDVLIDYLSKFDINQYKHGSVIKLNEFKWFDDNGDLRYRFELRN